MRMTNLVTGDDANRLFPSTTRIIYVQGLLQGDQARMRPVVKSCCT